MRDWAALVGPARNGTAHPLHKLAHTSHRITIAWIHTVQGRLEIEPTVMHAIQSTLYGQ